MSKPHIKLAKKLKQLGLYNGDLRKSMTPARKGAITRQYNKFKALIDRPENFVSKVVTKKRAATINVEAYAKSISKTKVRLFFKGQKVSIKKDHIVLDDGPFHEKIYEYKGYDILKRAEKAFEKLKKGEQITVRIGSSAPFNRAYSSFQDFSHYLNNVWKPKDAEEMEDEEGEPIDADEYKDELISQMSIVRINK